MPQPRKPEPVSGPTPTVFVVDDDDAMRRGMEFLISSAGYEVKAFESAQAFLDHYRTPMGGCLLLDVRMPGMDGIELLDLLRDRSIGIPVIFVTAFGNIPMAVRAVKTGAFDFIEKPFEGVELLARVRNALASAKQPLFGQRDSYEIHSRLASLTTREREVMHRIVAGMLNKQIAVEMNISIKTVEAHRAQAMTKMQAHCLAELVRMAAAIDFGSQPGAIRG